MNDDPKKLPPLTPQDWQNLVRMFMGLTVLGAVVIDIHPSRWPLIVDAAFRYGGAIPGHADLGSVTRLPLDLVTPEGLELRCLVRLWVPCPAPLEECSGCQAIAAQRYPEPEEEQLIAMPEDRGSPIIIPGDPRARGRGRVH